jgi:hypothetical protein
VKWYGKYGRKASWIVKRFGKFRRNLSWIGKRSRRKVRRIVIRYGRHGRKSVE